MNGSSPSPTFVKFSCPGCGQRIEAPSEAAGKLLACPACLAEITVPLESSASAAAGEALCAICQSALSLGGALTFCPACRAEYHADCWQENGGCAVYGCSRVPPTEGRAPLEIPVAFWGQEHKPCPVCNAQILAAAVRCRHCGSVFQTARPLDSAEFSRAASHQAQAPLLRRKIVWLFVLCVIPFSAPFAAIAGLLWLKARQEEVRSLPSLYGALGKIGVAVGLFQTGAITLLALIFALVRR